MNYLTNEDNGVLYFKPLLIIRIGLDKKNIIHLNPVLGYYLRARFNNAPL